MASGMVSRIMNTTHNSIKIKQTQKGGNNIVQSQSIHIDGDGNHVVGIHVDMDGNIIEHTVNDFTSGRKTAEQCREEIFKFHEEVAPKGPWSDWTLDDDVAVENMKRENEMNQIHNLLRKTYHCIKNSDPDIDKVDRLEDFLHFEDTDDYPEGYVLKRTVNGTNIEETYRILPAFVSKKFESVFKKMAYVETDTDPILHTEIYRAYNIYYRCKDGAIFYLVGINAGNKYTRIPTYLNECKLIQAKYWDNDTSYILVYEPKADIIVSECQKAVITKVTKTNMEKLVMLAKDMKWDLIAAVAGLVLYFILH